MDSSRQHDIHELKEGLKTAPDAVMRGNILKAGEKIQKEQHTGWVRQARQNMLKEKLAGRQENVRDIQDQVITQQRTNSASFGLAISAEDWERIYK